MRSLASYNFFFMGLRHPINKHQINIMTADWCSKGNKNTPNRKADTEYFSGGCLEKGVSGREKSECKGPMVRKSSI